MGSFLVSTFLGLLCLVSALNAWDGVSERKGIFDYLGRSNSYPNGNRQIYTDRRRPQTKPYYEPERPYYGPVRANYEPERPYYYEREGKEYYDERPNYYEPERQGPSKIPYPDYYQRSSNPYREFQKDFQFIFFKLKSILGAIDDLPQKIKDELDMMPDGTVGDVGEK